MADPIDLHKVSDGQSLKQNQTTFSVPRDNFMNMSALNSHLDYVDLKVLMFLLTTLNSFNPKNKSLSDYTKDPLNFKSVHAGQIAKTIGLDKKDVKGSIKHLTKLGIIEYGDSYSSKDGYRFTF